MSDGCFIKITFEKSTSPNYKKAIKLLKSFPHYKTIAEGAEINSVELSKEDFFEYFDKISELWGIISSWKSSEFFMNDKKLKYNELSNVLEVFRCYKRRENSVFKDDYCNQWRWKCQLLGEISLAMPNESFYNERTTYWFDFGKFIKGNVWKIDKLKLKQILEREISLKKIFLCPAFDKTNVYRVVDEELPDYINLDKSDEWEIRYKSVYIDGSLEKKAVGIKFKGIPYTYTFSIDEPDEEDNDDNRSISSQTSKRKRYIPKVTFEDIGGIDHIITIIREVIELPLKKPELFDFLGIKPHRGILLYGPPGCGKTMIAKAIANEVQAHFIGIKGPELLNPYVGVSEANLRNIFEEARELQPSIIFFDEIDAIAQKRSGSENLRLYSRFVNQLLSLMDGIEEFGNVTVIASTNRKELLDEALLRPGRFDYFLFIDKPTLEGCYQILKIKTRNMPIDENFDIYAFSKNLLGLSGAEINFVVVEAAYNCIRRNIDIIKLLKEDQNIDFSKLIITQRDFFEALLRIKNRTSTS